MLKRIRQFHLYSGLLFAPAIVFFAFSGVLQTFGFHEDQKDGSSAPYWIAAMAEVHKNQKLMDLPESSTAPTTGPRPASASETEKPADIQGAKLFEKGKSEARKSPRHKKSFALQIFIAIMSVGLIASVASGIFMAFAYQRNQKVIWALLIAGTLAPVSFLFL